MLTLLSLALLKSPLHSSLALPTNAESILIESLVESTLLKSLAESNPTHLPAESNAVFLPNAFLLPPPLFHLAKWRRHRIKVSHFAFCNGVVEIPQVAYLLCQAKQAVKSH